MKRFVLFFGATYYPSGGMGDYANSFDTLEEAQAEANRLFDRHTSYTWAQIADLEEMTVVYERDYEFRERETPRVPYIIEEGYL